MARQSARPFDARRRRWNWPHRITRAYRVGVSSVFRVVWNAVASSLVRMFNVANRATARHRPAYKPRTRLPLVPPRSLRKPRVTAVEVTQPGDGRRAGLLVSSGHGDHGGLRRRGAGRARVSEASARSVFRFGGDAGDLRFEEFAGDLSHCATVAAVIALMEEPAYGRTMGRKSVAALLDRLASIGASAQDTKMILGLLGLTWMQAGPLSCKVFRVRYDPFSDDVRWQHRSAYCVSFESWQGRPVFTIEADRPVYRCFVLFNAEDELIDWKAG